MAPLPSPALAAAAALLVAAASSTTEAFVSPSCPSSRSAAAFGLPTSTAAAAPASPRVPSFALHAEESESAADASEDEPAAEASEASEGEGEAKEEEEESGESEEEPEEDPEVTELKAKIAELEAEIKSKQSSLSQIKDTAEGYTEAGYLRKVAEMDQIRKMRGAAFKSNEFTAKANIVQKFLPVLDELSSLDEKYSGNEFAQSYSALKGTFSSALSALGASEYTAEVGSNVDVLRHEVVREDYSDDYAKGTVMEPVSMGMEIEGNVMRQAKVAASLGSEEEARKAEEEAAAAAKAKAEEEAAAAAAEADSEGEGEEETVSE